ncbi:hypothetical protein M404DRAFT_130098, partial [Pisolithus tinctorius Marx 270]
MCERCRRSLTGKSPSQPVDALANFQYYGWSELPSEVRDVFRSASPFELALVSLARASTITHHYQSKTVQGGRLPEEASQTYSRGNIAILPQDVTGLRHVLPPSVDDVKDTLCVVFCGGKFRPTKEALARFRPVLVSKSKVEIMINFLVAENQWYKLWGVRFDRANLESLLQGCEDVVPVQGMQITHLPSSSSDVNGSDHDWHDLCGELVMENVAYTMGDHSSQSCQTMKAQAMAHALGHGQFVSSASGSQLVSNSDPYLMSALFPHLDPWGIGSFNPPERSKAQQIPLERQVKNLLNQVDSPFVGDSSFAFVCWNLVQKREAGENITFSIKSCRRSELASQMRRLSDCVCEFAKKCSMGSIPKALSTDEKKVMHLFRELTVISKKLRGSAGYKLCRRNEIR